MEKRQKIWLLGLVVVSLFFGQRVAIADGGGKGYVDWTDGFVMANGYGDVPQGEQSDQSHSAALRAAEAAAHRILSETTLGVHIDSITTVADLMRRNDKIRNRVEAVLRGPIVTNRDMLVVNGTPLAAVAMKICLTGRSRQCAQQPVLLSEILQEQQAVLPLEPEQQPARANTITPSPPSTSPAPFFARPVLPSGWKPARCDTSRKVTGLIIQLIGHNYEKVLLPVVVSGERANQIVYSVKSIDPQVVRTHGAVRYVASLEQAQGMELVGENPVLITPVGVTKDNQIIIQPQDAATLQDTICNGNNYLEKARVVVVN
uniref:Uncharacterized protein n=1 Tax=Geobacter sp. (strain M21) TaxID=443144 RepID=C6DZC2_GEOSM